MLKIDKKELIRVVKERDKPERSNVTFRLNTELYNAFKAQCDKAGVKPTAMIEALLRAFTEQ